MNDDIVLVLAGILHVNMNVISAHGAAQFGGVLRADADPAPGSDIVFAQQIAVGDIVRSIFISGSCGILGSQLIGGTLLYIVNDDIVLVLAGVLHLNGQAAQRNTGRSVADKFQFSSVRFQRNGEIRNAVVGQRSGALRNGVVNAVGKAHGIGAVLIRSLIGSFYTDTLIDGEYSARQSLAGFVIFLNFNSVDGNRAVNVFNGLFAFFHRQLIFAVFQISRVKCGFAHLNAVYFYTFQLIACGRRDRCENRIRRLGEGRVADQSVSNRLGRAGYTLRKADGCYFQRTDFDYRSRYREVEGLIFSLFVLISQNSGFVQRNVDAVAVCACHNRRIQFDLVGHGCAAGYIRAGFPTDGIAADTDRRLRRLRQRRGGVQRSGTVGNIRLLGDQVHHAAHDVGNCTVVDDPQNGVQNIVEDAAEVSAYCIVVFVAAGSDVLQTFYLSGKANRIQLKVGFVAVFDGSRTVFCRSGSISAIGAGIGTVFAVYVRLTVGQQNHKFLIGGAAVAGGIEGFVSLNQACLDVGAAGASLPVTAVDFVTVKPTHFAGVDGSFNGRNIGGVGRAIFIENRGQSQLFFAETTELNHTDSCVNAFGDKRIDQCNLCLLGDLPAGAEILTAQILRAGLGVRFAFIVVVAVRAPPTVNNGFGRDIFGFAVVTVIITGISFFAVFPIDIIAAAVCADTIGMRVFVKTGATADAAAVNMVIHAFGVVGDQHNIDLRFYGSRTAAGNLQCDFPFVDGRLYRGFGQSHIVRRVDNRIRG